jgi:hypothetical protein
MAVKDWMRGECGRGLGGEKIKEDGGRRRLPGL